MVDFTDEQKEESYKRHGLVSDAEDAIDYLERTLKEVEGLKKKVEVDKKTVEYLDKTEASVKVALASMQNAKRRISIKEAGVYEIHDEGNVNVVKGS